MNIKGKSNNSTIRNLVIFTFLVVALGWFGRVLDTLMGSPSPQESTGMLLWLIAPFGVSLLLRAFAGDGWKDLGIKPAIKGNVLWYLISIFIYPIIAMLTLVTGLMSGAVSFLDFSSEKVPLFIQAFVFLLATTFFKCIFEEFAFRGYLAPKVYKLRLNPFAGHLVVGFIWGIWHLPYLAVITTYTTQRLSILIPLFLLGTIAASIVYGEIRLLTNSVWPAVIMHTIGGAFIGALLLQDFIVISSRAEFLISPALEGVMTIALFTLIGVGIYVLRRKREESS